MAAGLTPPRGEPGPMQWQDAASAPDSIPGWCVVLRNGVPTTVTRRLGRWWVAGTLQMHAAAYYIVLPDTPTGGHTEVTG